MELITPIDIEKAPFALKPCEKMLFVGSCFADEMGKRFAQDKFRVTVNPFGVMYNPASILHTVQRLAADTDWVARQAPRVAVLTLGTNHVYVLNETGEIVDNCRKRPQNLFTERELTVEECAGYLQKCIDVLREVNEQVHVVITVSPIRYRKYGFHRSQLSKATLLLAIDRLIDGKAEGISYFPSYEILMDELRDYRFYQPDMIHPTQQAVDHIHHYFVQAFFGKEVEDFLKEWNPIKAALNHRFFNPESEESRLFRQQTLDKLALLKEKYPEMED